MEELKQKYNIPDEAIFEIAQELEPDSEAPLETSILGVPSRQTSPSVLSQLNRGEIGIAEAIILMDFLDRRERREEDRRRPQSGTDIDKILDEMRNQRADWEKQRTEDRAYFEKLILGRRLEETESRAKVAEDEIKRRDEARYQQDMIDRAIAPYEEKVIELRSELSKLTPQQQQGFFDELLTEFGADLKSEFKDTLLKRLKGEQPPLIKTTEEGKTSIDYGATLNRFFDLGEKYLETLKERPPRLRVRPAETPTSPTGAGEQVEVPPWVIPIEPIEVKEKPATEVTTTEESKPYTPTPIPTNVISGIGPSFAEKLNEIGVTDVAKLSKVSPGHLADMLGVSKEKAEDWVKQAKDRMEQE